MKKRIAMLLAAAILLCGCALAEVPKLSGKLFDGAKKAVTYLSSGAYERLVTDLPYSGTAPSAAEWERFAGSFSSLSGAQTRYAVAYWNGGSWCVAVPLRAPDSDGVETLVLTSGDGSSFNGYRCVAWGRVRAEGAKSDYCYWNEEYAGASMLMADGE